MLRQAMLKRFGSSIRVEKARAGIYQLRQDKMSVLQYASAFESLFGSNREILMSHNTSVQLYFWTPSRNNRGLVYLQQPTSILAAKGLWQRELELTHQATAIHAKAY